MQRDGATISQVAAHAGVSAATVSRVFTGSARVSDVTRETVLAAARELGYRPSAIARSLARQQGIGIGMVVGDIGAPYYAPVMQSAERTLRDCGQMLVVASGYNRRKGELWAIDFLLEQRCAALIIHAGGLSNDELVALSRREVPIVVMNRRVPGLDGRCLWVDHYTAGTLVADYLVDHGHRALATITGPLAINDAADRHAGFRDRAGEHGVTLADSAIRHGDYSLESGTAAMRELLRDGMSWTAVFCGNDNMAVGAIEALTQAGYRVPEDVSVIGYDNTRLAALYRPRLTTVDIPIAAIGHAAAHTALAALQLPCEPVAHAFSGTLVEGDTVTQRL
ncbi:LacI family DNA-binding transcriptional regulator [Arhodomonas sp. AD133]|uniref:LacI family DNA-binding transcriptional regulator n=1 Tax=Arhodomonas sp. AD133 TaxID=3415009 RepID=UPI003EB9ADAB